jgi:calcineurin-like phosphoesterase family protein
MAIFVTSDLHFNHDKEFVWKVRGYESIYEMNEAIIERFNSVVQPSDDVYILGDLCLGGGGPAILANNKTLIERLNGRLHVIRGNHDTETRVRMYETCANVVDDVKWADMLRYKGYHFYLSHFPTLTGNLEKETLKQCTCNLFGHTHQTTNFHLDMPFMYHVGVDSHNCYPMNLDNIIEEMKAKVKECLAELGEEET